MKRITSLKDIIAQLKENSPDFSNFQSNLSATSTIFLKTPYGDLSYNSLATEDANAYIEHLINNGEFQYSFDSMDCVTYIENTLALSAALSQDNIEESFKENLRSIRYQHGVDTYIFRNHFTSADWIPNNTLLLPDITTTFENICTIQIAQADIRKADWMLKNKIKKEIPILDEEIFVTKINEYMRFYKSTLSTVTAKLNYITKESFMDNQKAFFENCPDMAVINIVRPNWNLKESIGTNLNVSHQGFLFKKQIEDKECFIFRHATSVGEKCVVELPFVEYISKFMDTPSVGGFNILAINLTGLEQQLKLQANEREKAKRLIEEERLKVTHSKVTSTKHI